MDFFCTHNSNREESISYFAVAVTRLRVDYEQQHAGVIYRNEDDELKLLDLRWHYDLHQSEPTDKFVWVDVPLDDLSKKHLAAVCEMIYQMNVDGVPYSISNDGATFLQTGEFNREHPHSGFTCATFVLSILHSQSFVVVDYNKWVSRPSDKVWQRQVIQQLHIGGASEEYIDAQLKQLNKGTDRFCPEDVCAAVAKGNWPVGYKEIEEDAKVLLQFAINHRSGNPH